MLTLQTKICQVERERERERTQYMKNDYYKRKKMVNDLINHAEELENVSFCE